MSMSAIFLPTLSMRRATWGLHLPPVLSNPFLPTLSMRRATIPTTLQVCQVMIFLPTLSMRRATQYRDWPDKKESGISTHALHAESDAQMVLFYCCGQTISTHALHAESDFVATPKSAITRVISTHALHAESDSKRQQKHIQNLQPICKNAKSLRFMPAYLTSHSL